jgi:hypothetical protein
MVTQTEEQKVFTYQTKSLDDLAVALAMGAEVVDVVREAGDRFFTFHLKGSFDIKAVALKLASRTLEMNAYDVLEANRRAKSIVHSR